MSKGTLKELPVVNIPIKMPIQSVSFREINGTIELIIILSKHPRSEYFKKYYQNNKDKYKKKVIRRQDRIEKHFADERARLAKIRYSYCANPYCLKPNRKYVMGTGTPHEVAGKIILFCNGNCKEGFLQNNLNYA